MQRQAGRVAMGRIIVPHANGRTERHETLRRRQAVAAQAHDGHARTLDHRSFNVARPTNARIIDTIQNRMTIVGSAQPFFSK